MSMTYVPQPVRIKIIDGYAQIITKAIVVNYYYDVYTNID